MENCAQLSVTSNDIGKCVEFVLRYCKKHRGEKRTACPVLVDLIINTGSVVSCLIHALESESLSSSEIFLASLDTVLRMRRGWRNCRRHCKGSWLLRSSQWSRHRFWGYFKFAMLWLNSCLMTHRKCCDVYHSSTDTLPRRVIDIRMEGGSRDTVPLLASPALHGENKSDLHPIIRSSYVCTSHCWGEREAFTTTNTSIKNRETCTTSENIAEDILGCDHYYISRLTSANLSIHFNRWGNSLISDSLICPEKS